MYKDFAGFDKKQSGAVSLIMVIFSALLITIIVVSFTRIMIKDQQQANSNDLSQSAYDAAQAGVEDAKRALLRYQNICKSGGDCTKAAEYFNSKCNDSIKTLSDISKTDSDSEIKVKTGTSGNSLDQAYTCVKVALNTSDYLGDLSNNESDIIELSSTKPFNAIKIEWFSSKDLSLDDKNTTDLLDPLNNVSGDNKTPLIKQDEWPLSRPPMMRAQLIEFSPNSNLSSLDHAVSGGSGASTLFLYPVSSGNSALSFANDNLRRSEAKSTPSAPYPVKCSKNLDVENYACNIKLDMPETITGSDGTVYLRLSALYNRAQYRITLLSEDTLNPPKFNGVQPEIDSTGRTNEIYRRVKTRVEMTDINFPYPDGAIDTTDSLCKDFLITDLDGDYVNGTCPE